MLTRATRAVSSYSSVSLSSSARTLPLKAASRMNSRKRDVEIVGRKCRMAYAPYSFETSKREALALGWVRVGRAKHSEKSARFGERCLLRARSSAARAREQDVCLRVQTKMLLLILL